MRTIEEYRELAAKAHALALNANQTNTKEDHLAAAEAHKLCATIAEQLKLDIANMHTDAVGHHMKSRRRIPRDFADF